MYITEKPAASTQTTFIWNRDYTSPSLPLCAFSLFLYLSLSKTYLSPSSLPFCLSLPFSRPVKTFLRGAFTLVPDTAKYLGCHRESASNQMARGFYTRIVCVCVHARADRGGCGDWNVNFSNPRALSGYTASLYPEQAVQES